MAKTAMTHTRITPEIKTEAERIIKGLGLSDRSTLFSRGQGSMNCDFIEYYGGSTDQRIRFAENRKLLHGPFYFAEYGSASRIDGPNTDI
jgi:hypothetical protein